ncbi:hypothetical protein CBG46_03100 [Actinobacillus succinogenes]|uniref:4-hydroxythreonine-4-phosphate dehydrogenase PdxA n=1 Tax=Actinobacillus succinogenes TaxID=67854 RepID=UPI0002E3D909|nr:hypothetical protein CBG46_03100 [Actinobacillus succinogenes]
MVILRLAWTSSDYFQSKITKYKVNTGLAYSCKRYGRNRPDNKICPSKDINIVNPFSPNTVFHRADNLGKFNMATVIYHDQHRIPIKLISPKNIVNIIAGLLL